MANFQNFWIALLDGITGYFLLVVRSGSDKSNSTVFATTLFWDSSYLKILEKHSQMTIETIDTANIDGAESV